MTSCPCPELIQRFGDLGCDVVEMVLASQDDWDRYAAAQWLNIRRWLDANPYGELTGQAVLQSVPGVDHGEAVQPGRDLVRVEQVRQRTGGGRARRLAAGRVRKSPDGQFELFPNCWCSSSAVAAAQGASQIVKAAACPRPHPASGTASRCRAADRAAWPGRP
jgi:hypothetical protein